MPEEDFDVGQLSESQRKALLDYTSLTNQQVQDAVPLLERSQWNVQIAVAKFFDGEGPDLVAEAMAAQNVPRTEARHENLQESLFASEARSPRRARAQQTDPAPRIVPRPPVTARTPWLIGLLLAPLRWGWSATTTLFRTLVYALSFLPASLWPQAVTSRLSTGFRSTNGRRMLMPRDTAARFQREFDEEYGPNELSFFEGGIAQAHDLAKKEVKFLLVVLMSPEHDETEPFVRETLLSPDVVSFLKDPTNNIILWGGNMLDSEAYQVSWEYACTKFPFSALVCLTPKEGSTRMGIVKRLVGPMPVETSLSALQTAMESYGSDLNGVRAERTAQEVARNLRNEQDSAYERSLAIDRERARQKKEAAAAAEAAEKKAKEEEEAADRLVASRQSWRAWRAGLIVPEPSSSDKNVVRVALKMPEESGVGRITRRFPQDAPMDELYAFVDCYHVLSDDGIRKGGAKPDAYVHQYPFRIVSTLPRMVFESSTTDTMLEKIGKSGNLIVETTASGEPDAWEEGDEAGPDVR